MKVFQPSFSPETDKQKISALARQFRVDNSINPGWYTVRNLKYCGGKSLRQGIDVHKEPFMTITIEFQDTVANILLSGNLDYSMQEDIRNVNQQAVSNTRVKDIQVNCAGITFLDSSVIRALLSLQKEADAAGKSLVLLNCNDTTREVFEIGGFDRMFTFR